MEKMFSGYYNFLIKILGYDYEKACIELNKIQMFSKDELKFWQTKKKWEIAKFHFNNNEFYKKIVGRFLPDIWEDLPVLDKEDFQSYHLLSSLNIKNKKGAYIAQTSGSSGKPFTFIKNKDAHAMDLALIANRYSWHNIGYKDKQGRLFGMPSNNYSFFKEKIKDMMLNRVRISFGEFSELELNNIISIIEEKKINYLYGYTNTLALVAQHLIKKGVPLNEINHNIKCVIVTAEMVTERTKDLLNKGFNLPIINEYGASEVGLIGFDSSKNEMILSEETLFVENLTIDSQKNIILTDFDNYLMPFIRYNIGDLGEIAESTTKENNNRRIKELYGRQNDFFYSENGKAYPGFSIVKPLDYFLFENKYKFTENIKEFVFRQKLKGELILDIKSEQKITKKEKNIIISHLIKSSMIDLKISINQTDVIERTDAGKLKQFISDLEL